MTTVRLVPTEGAYQKPLNASLVRETDTMWVVYSEEKGYEIRFSKRDNLRVGAEKNEFPRYRIEF